MRRTLIAMAAALALAAPAATAQQIGPRFHTALAPSADVSRNAAEQPAGVYKLDARHASVIWRVRHLGLSLYTGRFDTIAGSLTFDPQDPAKSRIEVQIDPNSVSTGLLNAKGERAFDREIAAGVFDSEQYPQISFVSREIEVTGPTTGLIKGDLTFRGQTRPVTLDAVFDGGRFVQFRGKQVLGFSAATVIDRKAFGAGFANPLADGAVSDEVEILISAEFIAE